MLHIGILGLPGSGKTTVFNVLARAHAPVSTYAGAVREPNRAVVRVPDPRLDALAPIFKPARIVPAEIEYVDVAGLVPGAAREGTAAFLGHLRTADVLLHVVRAFAGPLGEPRPLEDVETVDLELALADLGVVERRLERIVKEHQLGKGTPGERAQRELEIPLLERLKDGLEHGRPIRDHELTPAEELMIRSYAFLTAKPMLILLNVAEPGPAVEELIQRVRAAQPWRRTAVEWLAGQLEMELIELEPVEAEAFRREYGLAEPGADRVIRTTYRLADLISFFTGGPDELRAWTIRRGTTAQEAAGVIHTDLARGFIRAEVIDWRDLVAAGSLAEARRRGLVRTEGRQYVVQDGDVLHVLFSV